MSEPQAEEMLGTCLEVSSEDATSLIEKLANARVSAAYWKGLYEGTLPTLNYLKDRLNTLERRQSPPTQP